MCNLRSICKDWGREKNSESAKSQKQKTSGYFTDDVYPQIADLNILSKMFAADLCRHKNYMNYNGKWNRATPNTSARTTSKAKRDIFKIYFPFMKSIIDQARRFSPSGIKNMINQNDDIDLEKKKKKTKGFLIEVFGDFMSF